MNDDTRNASGRVAIVTGGTHGIGRATVETLARAGWRVVFQGRSEKEGRELAASNTALRYVPGDITEEATIRRLVACAEELGDGRIAGLVNNAGVGVRKRFEDCDASDWDRLFAINARSAFLVTRAALKGLRAARGAAVFISSVAGSGGEDGLSIYSATKAALIGLALTRVIEDRLSPRGRAGDGSFALGHSADAAGIAGRGGPCANRIDRTSATGGADS